MSITTSLLSQYISFSLPLLQNKQDPKKKKERKEKKTQPSDVAAPGIGAKTSAANNRSSG